jgi:hypothetical protein
MRASSAAALGKSPMASISRRSAANRSAKPARNPGSVGQTPAWRRLRWAMVTSKARTAAAGRDERTIGY